MSTLTPSQKNRRKNHLWKNLIKRKRNGKLKGRICANGELHHKFVLRDEAKLLMITLEELLSTMVIDAYEYKKVVIFNVPVVYLLTNLPKDKFMLLILEGDFVDIMFDINPEYKQHTRFKDGNNILYLQSLKEIYGMVESYILWYEIYMIILKGMGFQLNLYGMCVTNKDLNWNQCTIACYVDENKVSHVEHDVIDDVINQVEEMLPGLIVTKVNMHTLLLIKQGT